MESHIALIYPTPRTFDHFLEFSFGNFARSDAANNLAAILLVASLDIECTFLRVFDEIVDPSHIAAAALDNRGLDRRIKAVDLLDKLANVLSVKPIEFFKENSANPAPAPLPRGRRQKLKAKSTKRAKKKADK